MTKYTVPQQLQEGFKKLISLSPEDVNTLSSILESAEVGKGIKGILESNKDKISSLKENDDFQQVLQSLFSLTYIYIDSKNSIDKFTTDFADSYKASVDKSTDKEAAILKANLNTLLPSYGHIKLTQKASSLITENPHNFSEARIISDIRIVYNDDDDMSRKEQYALVVHHLKIKYSKGEEYEPKEFFVSMDLRDLKNLQVQIKRAIEKDELIRGKNHDLEFIDLI